MCIALLLQLKYSRWKVHNDWVEEARYIPKYDKVISVSCDKEKSIVMARLEPSTQLTDFLQDTERGKGKLRDAEDGPMKTVSARVDQVHVN